MTIQQRRARAIYLSPIMTLAWASGAVAQTLPQPGDANDGIRDIVVTAQRREERLQSVPVAVSALDQRALDSAQIDDLRDIAGRVPGLVVDTVAAGPSAAAISIRGISFEDIEKSFDPAVGVVVDGVFVGTNTGQLLDSFDMERLEVLRGPQGTLFGRNTIAGVISVTRTRPTDDPGVRASFAYSSYDTKRGRLLVNSGKLGGFLALKAFGFYDKTDGYYNNVTKNRREGRYETLSGGITARVTPTDNITATLTYEHQRERGELIVAPLSRTGLDLICAAPGAPGFSPAAECGRTVGTDLYTTYSAIDTPVSADTDAATANIDIGLGRFTLTSVTGYRKSKESVRQDFDASSVNFFDTLRPQDYQQFSQEVRLVGNITDNLNLLVGGYYFTSNYQNDQRTNFGVILGQGQTPQLRQYVDHKSKSYAGFADARLKLSERFSLGAGIRYTSDDKRIFNNYGRIGSLVAITLPTFNGIECVAVTGTISPAPGVVLPVYSRANNCSGQKSFGKFTWRANANFQIDPDKLLYASFAKGFRSGGFNGRSSSPTTLGPYDPETVDSYELGLKADWLNRRLRTNIALYYAKYNNKQEEIVQAAPPGSASPQETVVKNASSANIKGIELEVIAQLSRALTFNGSFSYIDAKFNRFFNDVNRDNIPDDVSTLTLRRAPKFQWSAGLNYSRTIGNGRLDASTILRFQSKYQTCITPARPIVLGAVVNDPRCQTRDREDLSAQIGYAFFLGDDREVRLSVFGRNLTNVRDLNSTLPVAGLFTFGTGRPPRVIGAEVGFNF